jgi:uncharacterized caspase-like protein
MALADHALVVGISRYPGIENLSGPETDATEFFAWVTSKDGGGVDAANAKLILSSDFLPAAADAKDERPAQAQIHDFFTDVDILADANNQQRLGQRAGRRLWMFFSGHGFAPSIDTSGLLTANSTLKRTYSIGAARWADRLFVGGWFDEVLLFQDACRSRIPAADLDGVFLELRETSQVRERRRFYAFSAKDQKLSKEIPFPDGKVRGVFTATLLEGLRGAARDNATGAITARSLKTYLQDTMRSHLPDADRKNPEIANEPDVRDFDVFDIVPPPSSFLNLSPPTDDLKKFTVDITLPSAGLAVTLQDGNLKTIKTATPAGNVWSIELQRGLYRVVATGLDMSFSVAGPGPAAGGAVNVRA